ncbi:TolB amino-terminal domain-containing protein [Rhodospirillales bacterium URHD0017]|nr:TolB amino-terminal domain-containing protein [Rhodospirillales bacterium URHD0017]
MTQERLERRLTAILAADVVGYSRLMGMDEEGTLAALKKVRREVADLKIAEHRGRIVQTGGDSLLAEFYSVVDAVRCAVEMQREMAGRNADMAKERRIEFRIGINLGDIIVDQNDIFGDGVNLAARLETLAEPGGICVSRVVRDQVRDKIGVSFGDMGEQRVKNIARPVRTYRVLLAAEARASSPPTQTVAPRPLADRPAIAVLPFNNVTGDAEQGYFVDGITEDIITALSKWRWFLVIARNSTFAYHGKSVDLKQVRGDLGVRYVLEGSVRKAGRRVRITCQLFDTADGTNLWAERYDRDLTDIFDVQDEITSRVVAAIEPALSRAESRRGATKSPEHMSAWDYCQRGFWHLNKLTGTDGAAAYGLFKTAIALDPDLAEAHLGLARALIAQWDYGSVEDFAPPVGEARQSGLRAAELDGENPYAQYVLAQTSHWAGDVQTAIAYASRAVELNVNFALGHFYLGVVLSLDGRHEEALQALDMGLRLSPRDPRMSTWLANKARALYHLQRYTEAIEAATAARRIRPHAYGLLVLAASCAQLERNEEAAKVLAEIRTLPGGSAQIARWYLDRYNDPTARAHMTEGLRKAGILDDEG